MVFDKIIIKLRNISLKLAYFITVIIIVIMVIIHYSDYFLKANNFSDFRNGIIKPTYFKHYNLTNNAVSIVNLSLSDLAITHYFCNIDDCFNNLLKVINHTNAYCGFYNADLLLKRLSDISNLTVILDQNSKKNFSRYGIKAHIVYINYSRGIFHSKFCITNKTVIIQSFNPTFKNALFDVNDQFIFSSHKLATVLRSLMNITNIKSHKSFKIYVNNDLIITNYNIENLILKEISNQSHFMLFLLTRQNIVKQLLMTNSSGLRSTYNNRYVVFPENHTYYFRNKVGRLHLKVFFNSNSVISGSYNPTKSALLYNYELDLLLNNKSLAHDYLEFYNFLKNLTLHETNVDYVERLIYDSGLSIKSSIDVLYDSKSKKKNYCWSYENYNFSKCKSLINSNKMITYSAFVPVKTNNYDN